MTDENTTPATVEKKKPDHCAKWTHNGCPIGSRCPFDGVRCDTEDCVLFKPKDPEHNCCDEGEDACSDPDAKDSPTPEEIMAAYNHLQELVKRSDTCAICTLTMDNGEQNAFRSESSRNLQIPESVNDPIPGWPWLAILGYAQQMHKSLAQIDSAMTEGIRHYIENQANTRRAQELSGIASMLGSITGAKPTPHFGVEESTEA